MSGKKLYLERLPPLVRTAVFNDIGARHVTSIGNDDIPRANLLSHVSDSRFVDNISNMYSDIDVGMVLLHNVLGLLERLHSATKNVDSARSSLSKGINDYPSDTLTSTCHDNGLAGLGKFRSSGVNGVVRIVVPFGNWSWVRWLHCEFEDAGGSTGSIETTRDYLMH